MNLIKLLTPKNTKYIWAFGILILIIAFVFKPTTEPDLDTAQKQILIREEVPDSQPNIRVQDTVFIGKEISQVGSAFGTLLQTTPVGPNLKSNKFSAGRAHYPIEVITDETDAIKAVLEPSLNFKSGDLERLETELGLPGPDFEMFVINDYMVKVHVYLSRGIALEASEIAGHVFNKIYFSTTDKEGFLRMFPNRYSETEVPHIDKYQ